jgi:hypothetical protein
VRSRRSQGSTRSGPITPASRRRDAADARRSNLIGRDLARTRLTADVRRRWLPAALIGLLLAALCLAALRIDGIRQRYALAAAMREEKQLLEERAVLTARMRGLRDPARLARHASRRDFRRPDHVIELSAVSAETRP